MRGFSMSKKRTSVSGKLAIDDVCIILTDNLYLYLGIAASLPTLKCKHASFSGNMSANFNSKEPIILIDSMIFFSRVWTNFTALFEKFPQGKFSWIPNGHRERFLLDTVFLIKRCDIADPISFSRAVDKHLKNKCVEKHVKNYSLSSVEKRLFQCFFMGMSVHNISKYIKRPASYIYASRMQLSKKMGLKHPCYLSFHLKKISVYALEFNLFHSQ